MQCRQRLQLERKHQEASAIYAAAMHNLHERMPICTKDEYMILSATVDLAWSSLEQILSELDQHVEKHCCLAHRNRSA